MLALRKLFASRDIFIALILFAFAGLFFPLAVSNLSLAILLVYTLLQLKPADYLATLRRNRILQLILVLYALLIIGLSYSANFSNGAFILEKRLSLLLIPVLLIPGLEKKKPDSDALLFGLGAVAFLSSIVMLSMATYRLMVLNDADAFYFENLPPIHYVYYSLAFACGMLILLDFVLRDIGSRRGILVSILLFSYSLGILILVASKTGIIAFAVASGWLCYHRILNRKMFLFATVLLMVTGSVLLYFNDTSRKRFVGLTEHLSVLTMDNLGDQSVNITDLNMRLLFWKISITHVIRDQVWIFGVGTGDTQDYLDALYVLPAYQLYGYVGWDTHNQWVFTFVQLGVIGILLMGALFYQSFRVAMQTHNISFFGVLLMTTAFSFSESILESNKGIVLVALLLAVFAAGITPARKESAEA
jgi:hypothetical protein